MIKLKEISKEEAFRYMGGDYSSINDEELKILKENEKLLLENINVRYVYKVFDIDNETMMIGPNIKLEGQSIKNHLKDCNKVIFLAVTLSSESTTRITPNTGLEKERSRETATIILYLYSTLFSSAHRLKTADVHINSSMASIWTVVRCIKSLI